MPQKKLIDQMGRSFMAMELCTHFLVNNRLWNYAPIFIVNLTVTMNAPVAIAREFWVTVLVVTELVSGRVYFSRLYIVLKYYQTITHFSFVQKRALVN